MSEGHLQEGEDKLSNTASPLAGLGGGTGMFSQETLAGTADEALATPTFRKATAATKAPGASHATKGQRDLLRTMISERVGQPGVDDIRERLTQALQGGYLTTTIFEESFEALKVIPRAAATSDRPVSTRRNKYAQRCNQCNRMVPEGAGLLDKSDEGKWVVWHEVCPSDFPFPEGRYAIDNADGEIRFYHLYDARVFVMASDTEHEIHGHAAEAIVAQIAEDPAEASKRYGREKVACGICGRSLTDTSPGGSREIGIGPVCREKVGW